MQVKELPTFYWTLCRTDYRTHCTHSTRPQRFMNKKWLKWLSFLSVLYWQWYTYMIHQSTGDRVWRITYRYIKHYFFLSISYMNMSMFINWYTVSLYILYILLHDRRYPIPRLPTYLNFTYCWTLSAIQSMPR